MKKIITAAVIMSMAALFTACEEISQEPLNKTDSSAYAPTEEVTEYVEETVSFTEYVAKVPEINTTEASMTIEAEDCKLNGSLYTDEQRKGFSGNGYVTGFYGGSADYLVIPADIPVSHFLLFSIKQIIFLFVIFLYNIFGRPINRSAAITAILIAVKPFPAKKDAITAIN